MSANFNLVKKPKKEEVEVEDELNEEEQPDDLDDDFIVEEDESLNSSSSSDNSSELKKRLVLIMGIVFIGLLLLLLILYVASLFSHRTYSYENIENIMKNAAISYFNDYPDQLPNVVGNIVEIDSSNLVAAGKMKPFSEYRSDGDACTGSVLVQKNSTDYTYVPYLNCGEAYYTIELHKKVIEDSPTVSSGDGLYSSNGNYVFRGEIVNNYVKLEDSLWRIVKITSDGSIMLIHADGLTVYKPWDNRYNEKYKSNYGINKYSVSRIKEYLDTIYSTTDERYVLFTDKDKVRLIDFTLCIGGRDEKSSSKNNTEECKSKLPNQKIGLLTLSDYVYASIDTNCKKVTDRSCTNYNYLTINVDWWLVTADSNDTSYVYKVDRSGIVYKDPASTYGAVRPVVYINSRTMTTGGTGTHDDPYILK